MADPETAGSAALQKRLDVEFRDPELLELALTHRSWAYEHGAAETNERLELLGDAVLDLVVTDMLYRAFPEHEEGNLAKLRASLVSEPALAAVAAELELGQHLKLGRGEKLTGGPDKPSISSDALEAVIGAVYVDRGWATARRVIRSLFSARVAAAAGREIPKDDKTRLQEVVTQRLGVLPRYRLTGWGPDHEKRFRAEVFVADESCGIGEGRSKKEAEQAAAAQALERLATLKSAEVMRGA